MSIPITDHCRRCHKELPLVSERLGCRTCFDAGYDLNPPVLCATCLDLHRLDVHGIELPTNPSKDES